MNQIATTTEAAEFAIVDHLASLGQNTDNINETETLAALMSAAGGDASEIIEGYYSDDELLSAIVYM